MKQYINKHRMQQLAGINEIKVSQPVRMWDWNIEEFGYYDPLNKTFTVESGDAFADYMDTEFPDWLNNEYVAKKGIEKYTKDIKNAVKKEYGSDVTIIGDNFSY